MPQAELVDTALKAAVDEASHLLGSLAMRDDSDFQEAVLSVDQRVLSTAREFFNLMRENEATFRLVAGPADTSFSTEAVARAAERIVSTLVEDSEESIEGQLSGVLPDAHQFEFWAPPPRGTIRGKVDRNIPTSDLAAFNHTWVGIDAKAVFQVRRVRQHNEVVRESFTLLRLESADRPRPVIAQPTSS